MDQHPISPANRLAEQNSPYLRQHAHNPVDWWPWCADALALARSSGKPILLSIGYSACHWCHVMAHESFEDPAVAALMNRLFVNIKVDREERPDLDRIYQLAQQMLTARSGGWPLTMFLMHDDQRPFFGGTYFPREARFGLPAFAELLQQVSDYYHAHREQLREPAAQIVAALTDLNPSALAQQVLDNAPLLSSRAAMERSFDRDYGGFGGAPKFPHAPGLSWLLRVWYASARDAVPDLQALYMASLTLTRMVEGGLFDQLGGGFFRYSVDERWEIPHFEKMLYDNAQLLSVLAEAAQATGEPLFSDAASRTADWMLRELGAGHDGTLSSSLDADSEGHEGRFYVWTREAVRTVLSAEQWPLFAARFGLDAAPNFEGQWHLRVYASIESLAEQTRTTAEQVGASLLSARSLLLAVRERRVHPGLDDKVLGSWNALAISALATAARCLRRDDYAQSATTALAQLRRSHWRDGRLSVGGSGSAALLPAYLDDYAYLCEAILELASVRVRAGELHWAVELAEVLLAHFEDGGSGGFFFTADDAEQLINRPKTYSDEAVPAGNAIAARALLRLGYLLAEPRYLASAERVLRSAWPAIEKYPQAHASMLLALQEYLTPPAIVILRGQSDAVQAWHQQLNSVYAPDRWTLAVPNELSGLPASLASKPADGPVCAYVCRGLQCTAALTSLPQLLQQLQDPAPMR